MLGELEPTRTWCEELRVLLKLAKAASPLAADDADDDDELEAPPDPAGTSEAALVLKTSFQQRFGKDPAGATPAQIERLRNFRSLFSNTYSGAADETRLGLISAVFGDMVKVYEIEAAQCAKRKEVADQLEALAPAGAKGSALMPGAFDEDTVTLELLRNKARAALDSADSVDEIMAMAGDVEAVARERDALELRIEARSEQAERIKADAQALLAPPESPKGSLDTEHAAVLEHLKTHDGMPKAEEALLKLRSAWEPLQKEALALRQMRAMFMAESAKVRERVLMLQGGLAAKAKVKADSVLQELTKAEKKLAVTAGRAETEKFPAELDLVKNLSVMGLVASMIGGRNTDPPVVAAIDYLRVELKRCAIEATQLPQLDGELEGFAATVDAQILAAGKLVGGSGGDVGKARAAVDACCKLLVKWRGIAGPLGIVLGQRKEALRLMFLPPNPPDADPAFAVAMDPIRRQVGDLLAAKMTELSVTEAETHAQPFPALLKKATDDAVAARRAAAAQLLLDTEFTGTCDAARPAARAELVKLKALVDARPVLSGMDRQMAQTATVLEGVVARMKAVAAEGRFADTPKAPFADLAEGARELAFTVCGPALVTSLDKKAKAALSAVLLSDGPAIRQLAEGPLGGNPKLLAKMLTSCGAGGLASLARALGGDEGAAARASLEGLIDKCGLGGDPDILSRLLGDAPKDSDNAAVTLAKQQAQVRNAAGLKSLADNFSGDEGQAAMSALMLDGGLATSPGALASLMQKGGFDGDGAEMRAFADAFVGDSEGLKRVVTTAGVAEHPAVLGPLAKAAGADGVKSIAAAFVQPADCARLKGLLDSGGMGGDTSLPGKKHEHPDTLSKVFVDGLGGEGDKLKAYAKAFGSPAGRVDSKRMLDAFNEYPDYVEEPPKDYRQPGQGIALLLGGQQLKGTPEQRIAKLATQFVPNIKAIAEGPQRNQAIRMAPHMAVDTAVEGWKPQSQEMEDQGIERVTASVLKRHQPETFVQAKAKAEQSMFPPGTDVGALLDEAMTQLPADRTRAHTIPVTVSPPPITISVEIGFLNDTTVNHFGPRGNLVTPHPQETPKFTLAEINAIFAAIK